MGKGESEHFYTNIPIENFPSISYKGACALTVLSADNEIFLAQEQRKLNETLTTQNNVSFRVSV